MFSNHVDGIGVAIFSKISPLWSQLWASKGSRLMLDQFNQLGFWPRDADLNFFGGQN